jgi:hypothetical protein
MDIFLNVLEMSFGLWKAQVAAEDQPVVKVTTKMKTLYDQ